MDIAFSSKIIADGKSVHEEKHINRENPFLTFVIVKGGDTILVN
jgi:hypothetical protein